MIIVYFKIIKWWIFCHSSSWLIFFCSGCSLKDMGTVILGKLESGSISKAQQLTMMPNRVRFCLALLCPPVRRPAVSVKRRPMRFCILSDADPKK